MVDEQTERMNRATRRRLGLFVKNPTTCTCESINHDHDDECNRMPSYRGGECSVCRYWFFKDHRRE